MNEFWEAKVKLDWATLGRSYDVVIIGGGGHGLSIAYHLAVRHGITNVAVIERDYIGGGNSGRNTTVIRSNYGIPEAVRFYQRSIELYQQLEAETERWIMHSQRGLWWMTHTEAGRRNEMARAAINQAFGANTVFVEPEDIARELPGVNLDVDGEFPVMGASVQLDAATARHDRVNWALAEGAMRAGVTIVQGVEVTGMITERERVVGVETTEGPVAAGTVVGAVGGHATSIASMAGVRLPIRTHPLQAFVTNHYERTFDPIVASAELGFYISQTARGEMLGGSHIEPQPSYSRRAGYDFINEIAGRIVALFPFMGHLRVLRQWAGICDMSPDYSPVMGRTSAPGFLVTTGWGTWGFKAIPAGGEAMAELIATGETPELIAPFSIDRFRQDRTLADRGSSGTH
ncbi:MAG: FAD-dependent oxidoreductase [Actinomycetota bacterium]